MAMTDRWIQCCQMYVDGTYLRLISYSMSGDEVQVNFHSNTAAADHLH